MLPIKKISIWLFKVSKSSELSHAYIFKNPGTFVYVFNKFSFTYEMLPLMLSPHLAHWPGEWIWCLSASWVLAGGKHSTEDVMLKETFAHWPVLDEEIPLLIPAEVPHVHNDGCLQGVLPLLEGTVKLLPGLVREMVVATHHEHDLVHFFIQRLFSVEKDILFAYLF